ncbi:hypothetical protein [Winogradskyella sp. SYSU M77433]|uniref:hypothetical protein n=1 Tax=Winogradskyella sp. SYSU M77433 TaxID=3042722 RepID=UPI002480DA44|nr:hypothetical protein [Winogradskyella sp. SYSU M77433]MDH7913154.1 hypothetical protein [Winogradskyella sp. SYSU M77433]
MTKNTEIKIITHEISNIGRVDICLFGEAKKFYDNLEENGIINNLKKMDHLGFISKAHPGNNHKRWDYVCLQLLVLQKLKHSIFNTGLNYSIKELDQISKLEFMQCGILLSNIGHLHGTLATEKSFLIFLLKSKSRQNEFLSEISKDKRWDEFTKKIILNYDFYKVKYLIALNYIKKNYNEDLINRITYTFLHNTMVEDSPKFRKLKQILLKIRSLSFLYMDSFNSDFPFQISIHKILMNIYNYDSLFLSKTKDFDSFFDSTETALTKKLYISENGSFSLAKNENLSLERFTKYYQIQGKKSLNLKNLLCSIIDSKHDFEPQIFNNIDSFLRFQFYISLDEIHFLGRALATYDFEKASFDLYKKENLLNLNLQKDTSKNIAFLRFMHDNRKKLFFLNLFINKSKLASKDLIHLFNNYKNVFHEFLSAYKFIGELNMLEEFFYSELNRHVVRKFFLYSLKLLFTHEYRQDVYISYDYQKTISALSESARHETGHLKSKKAFYDVLDWWSKKTLIKENHSDILNNLKVMKEIVKSESKIPTQGLNIYYCLFPVQIDDIAYDANNADKTGNPEKRKSVTDIDCLLMLFNKQKFEYYLIEGKDSRRYQRAIRKDFDLIKKRLLFPSKFSQIKYVSKKCKGGYILLKNFK